MSRHTEPPADGFRRALTATLLASLPGVAIALHPLANNDLPLHLAIGEWILEHRQLPNRDPFSFTAGGTPWVPHEWLAGVLFARVHEWGGTLGLNALLLAGTLMLGWVHRLVARSLGIDDVRYLGWSIPLWILVGPRLILRPHLLVFALVFGLWCILLRSRRRPALLWAVPAVMALWVNFHGSFLLGFGIVALDFLLGHREHTGHWRFRFFILLATLATLFLQVHAYFQLDPWAAIMHPVRLLQDPVFMREIEEWQAPFSAESTSFHRTIPFALSLPWLGVALYGLWHYRKTLPRSYLVFIVVAGVLFVRHQRFLALFALASVPAMPPLKAFARDRARRVLPAAALLVSVLFLYPGYPYRWDQAPRRAGIGWNRRHLPFEHVEYLTHIAYEGPILCEYHFGGLIAWKSRGRMRVSMDSRNSVYGARLYLLHSRALAVDTFLMKEPERADAPQVKEALEFRHQLLERCGAVLIQGPEQNPYRRGLAAVLAADPAWFEKVRDLVSGARLYVRKVTSPEER